MEGAKRPGVQLVPIANVRFVRGGAIYAPVFEHYRDIIIDGLRKALPVDAVFLALHGAAAVHKPYEDAEASLIRAVRAVCEACGMSLMGRSRGEDWVGQLFGKACDTIHGVCSVK